MKTQGVERTHVSRPLRASRKHRRVIQCRECRRTREHYCHGLCCSCYGRLSRRYMTLHAGIVPADKAGAYGMAIEAIARRRNGAGVRPEDIVNAARFKSSSLHEYFFWERTVPAEKWRIVRAADLLMYVKPKGWADEKR